MYSTCKDNVNYLFIIKLYIEVEQGRLKNKIQPGARWQRIEIISLEIKIVGNVLCLFSY